MRKTVSITTDEWFNEVFPKQRERLKGYYTVTELAEKTDVNLRTMNDRVRRLLKAGLLDETKVIINGRLRKAYKPYDMKKVKQFLFKQ